MRRWRKWGVLPVTLYTHEPCLNSVVSRELMAFVVMGYADMFRINSAQWVKPVILPECIYLVQFKLYG